MKQNRTADMILTDLHKKEKKVQPLPDANQLSKPAARRMYEKYSILASAYYQNKMQADMIRKGRIFYLRK